MVADLPLEVFVAAVLDQPGPLPQQLAALETQQRLASRDASGSAARESERALALARQAIKLDPKRASAHMLDGEALLAKGNAGDGSKELETARDDDPTIVRAHWDLLRAYATAGRKHDAELEQQEMEQLYRSQSPGARSQLGDAPRNQESPR